MFSTAALLVRGCCLPNDYIRLMINYELNEYVVMAQQNKAS